MFSQIVAFLAVATSVAFASTCGYCYPGYGSYINAVPALTTGVSSGVCGSRILSADYVTPLASRVYAAPMIASGVTATLPFTAAVGRPEVVSSCENSVAAPVVSTGSVYYRSGCGLGYGCGSTLGGCGTGAIATAC